MSGPIDWEEAEDSFVTPSLAAGDAVGWFDKLYAAAADGQVTMPWSRADPHPLLVDWVGGSELRGVGRSAVIVGCALGADAEFVASFGFRTTAFDVSTTAIRLARERFPDSAVSYVSADLLDPPTEWSGAFDLVVEIITLQALPPVLHPAAAASIRGFLAPNGTLLVIGAVPDENVAAPPWELTRTEMDAIATDGVRAVAVEMLPMPGRPGERRWRAEYSRD